MKLRSIKNNPVYAIVTGILCAILGIFMLIMTTSDQREEQRFMKTAEEIGVCVTKINSETRHTRRGSYKIYDLIVEYEYNGQLYQNVKLSNVGNDAASLVEGDWIYAYVDPANPGDCRLQTKESSFSIQYIIDIVLIIGGLVSLISGIVRIAAAKKHSVPQSMPVSSYNDPLSTYNGPYTEQNNYNHFQSSPTQQTSDYPYSQQQMPAQQTPNYQYSPQQIPTQQTPNYQYSQQQMPAQQTPNYQYSQQQMPTQQTPNYQYSQQQMPVQQTPNYQYSQQSSEPVDLSQIIKHDDDHFSEYAANLPANDYSSIIRNDEGSGITSPQQTPTNNSESGEY